MFKLATMLTAVTMLATASAAVSTGRGYDREALIKHYMAIAEANAAVCRLDVDRCIRGYVDPVMSGPLPMEPKR
jgi:uncharacterized iron-regulated protein